MRKPIMAGNWKMHNTVGEARALAGELVRLTAGLTEPEIVICPVFTALSAVQEILAGSNIALGAQNMHWADKGAFTGEVSPLMLRDLGCRYVIIGHSERRQYFAEIDETVNKKLPAALAAGLTPIMCVGETLAEREQDLTAAVIARQVKTGLAGLEPGQVAAMVIAYEPIWAIGTGRTASAAEANQVVRYIRRTVADLCGPAADQVRIQYGGSVKPGNIAELMATSDIDGALVGGASLTAADFDKIIRFSTRVK